MFGTTTSPFGGTSTPFGGNGGNGKPKVKMVYYSAMICRIIPKQRADPQSTPRLEVLIQKHQSGNYGFVSTMEKSEVNSASSTKQKLRQQFMKQCGNNQRMKDKLEVPPLTPVKDVGKNWIFIIPSCFNNWRPQPSVQHKFLDYSNEKIMLDKQQYDAHFGYAWVNFVDFASECNSQKSGQAPKTKIERSTVDLISKSFKTICDHITSKLKTAYHRTLSCASSTPTATLLFQDIVFQVEATIAYDQKQFQLTFKNLSKYSDMQLTIQNVTCPSPQLINIVNSEIKQNEIKAITKGGNLNCKFQYDISGFFGFEDLPVFDIWYLIDNGLFRARVKIPIFLMRYCNLLPVQQQSQLEQFWSQLPTEVTIPVSMGSISNSDKQKFFTELLPKLGLPKLDAIGNFFPLVAQLGDKGCIFLLSFEDGQNNMVVFKIQCKHSEPKVFQSYCELLYGASTATPGFEDSFLDVPPFTD